MQVEELERGSGGLIDENEEQGDDREPELGVAQFAGAAGAHLEKSANS